MIEAELEQLRGTHTSHPVRCRLVTLRPSAPTQICRETLLGNLRIGTNHSGRAHCVLVTVCAVPLILFSGKDTVLNGTEERSLLQDSISLVPPVMGVDWEMNRSPLHWD